jgi:hypothetical protein
MNTSDCPGTLEMSGSVESILDLRIHLQVKRNSLTNALRHSRQEYGLHTISNQTSNFYTNMQASYRL